MALVFALLFSMGNVVTTAVVLNSRDWERLGPILFGLNFLLFVLLPLVGFGLLQYLRS